jgi:hypothetical protein
MAASFLTMPNRLHALPECIILGQLGHRYHHPFRFLERMDTHPRFQETS